MQIVGKSCLWWMTLPLALKGCIREAGELRIGFTSSAPFIRAVSDTLSLFRRDYPDVHLQTREMNTREQIAPLIEGTLDMGLLRNTALPETLEHAVIVHEPLMAMIPHDHPWQITRV